MKVKELIERLTKYNNMDDDIIVDYVTHQDVNGWFDYSFTNDEWKKFIMETEKQGYGYLVNDYLYDIARKIYKREGNNE